MDTSMFAGCVKAMWFGAFVCAVIGALLWELIKLLMSHIHMGWH